MIDINIKKGNIIRKIEIDDATQFINLAMKAVYERGLNDVDFDKPMFYARCRSILARAANHTIGLFVDDELVGFSIAQITTQPWSTEKICYLNLMHTDTGHRHEAYYQLMLDSIFTWAKGQKITRFHTSTMAYLLPEQTRTNMLIKNGYREADIIWEKKID